jgi:hypothetical protein
MIRSRHLRHGLTAVILVNALVVLAGCSGEDSRYPVEGSVTFDGKPVDGGTIDFFPAESTQGDISKRVKAHGDIQGGKYALESDKRPNAGKYRVEITWYKKTGKKISNDPPNMIDETIQVIPKLYNVQSTTIVEIKSGANSFSYDMKADKTPAKGGKYRPDN